MCVHMCISMYTYIYMYLMSCMCGCIPMQIRVCKYVSDVYLQLYPYICACVFNYHIWDCMCRYLRHADVPLRKKHSRFQHPKMHSLNTLAGWLCQARKVPEGLVGKLVGEDHH